MTRITKITLTLCIFCTLAVAQQTGTFTDPRDGQKYRTVKIGNLTWMAQNLNYETDKSWCYDNSDSNCQKYGRLYEWDVAMEACPMGWRLPDCADWSDLVMAVGGGRIAGKKLKSKTGWGNNGNGTDEFGFSALPGGSYHSDNRGPWAWSLSFGFEGKWWSATIGNDGGGLYGKILFSNTDQAAIYYDFDLQGIGSAFSVRCIQ